MWHLYNLIRPGDLATCVTFRKVTREGAGGLGPSSSERVRVVLSLRVTAVDLDAEAGELRITGLNERENEHVRLGASHSATVEAGRSVTLHKEAWDSADLGRLKEASDPTSGADVAALAVDRGRAALFLVGPAATAQRGKVEASLPRKRGVGGEAGYERAWGAFLDKTAAMVLVGVDWETVRCLVICGPGFAKEEVLARLLEIAEKGASGTGAKAAKAVKTSESGKASGGGKGSDKPSGGGKGSDKPSGGGKGSEKSSVCDKSSAPLNPYVAMLRNRDRIVLAPAANASASAVREALASPQAAKLVADARAARDARLLDDFLATLEADSSRAFYGPGQVRAAHALGGIDTLLVSDDVFRSRDVAKRASVVRLCDEARRAGATVAVLSVAHETGKQVQALGGFAAKLRFPMPQLEEGEYDPETGEEINAEAHAV